jgi:hypothetical protein
VESASGGAGALLWRAGTGVPVGQRAAASGPVDRQWPGGLARWWLSGHNILFKSDQSNSQPSFSFLLRSE